MLRNLKFILFGIHLLVSSGVFSLNSYDLSIQMITGPVFHSDQNQCNSGIGPRAVYVGLEICNTSGLPMDNIQITLSGFTAAGYSLAGNQNPTLSVKSPLLAGSCDTLFWFCTYPCGNSNTDIIFTASDADDGTSFTDTVVSVSSLRELSANAGGFVNSTTLTLQDSINKIDCFTVYYGLSRLVAGNQVFFQPVANLDFKANCYQLEHATVLSSDANSPDCVPVGPCPLYYSIQGDCGFSPNWVVVIEYCFKVQCVNSTTAVIPYASATSGNDLKYTIASQPLILPVELIRFAAEPAGEGVHIAWDVLSEPGVAYYEVQRSPDGLSFDALYQEASQSLAVPAGPEINYTATDANPLPVGYYRLRIVEQDSSYSYSQIVRVNTDRLNAQRYVLFPNPVRDELQVLDNRTGGSPDDDLQVEITDISGQVVWAEQLASGNDRLDLNGIVPGMYLVRIRSGSFSEVSKIIRQ